MDKYISVPLEPEYIVDFYDDCRDILNPPFNEDAQYDCTKIEVSEERFNILQSFYLGLGESSEAFAMRWCMVGPKVNHELHGEVVKIEEGFIC